jgi:hypothetical protein
MEAWVRRVGLRSGATDPLLAWLLPRVRDQPEPYQEVLLLVALRELDGIRSRLYYLDDDPWALWTNITWEFLRIACGWKLEQRPQLLGKKLVNDTQHAVRHRYTRQFASNRSFRRPPPRKLKDQKRALIDAIAVDDPGYGSVDLKIDALRVRTALRNLVRAGQLSPTDYLILIGCHYYGRSLESMARRLGLTYEAAKKRRQRVTDNLPGISKILSPEGRETPL